MKQEKCGIAVSDILLSWTGRKCLVTLDPILGQNLFHADLPLPFSTSPHKKDRLYICWDCGPCAHLFMDKLHRHRWKARYWFTQKAVPCKWPQLCNFCRQLSAAFLPLKSPTAFSGRWKLSINTTFVKYDPSNTWTQWRKTGRGKSKVYFCKVYQAYASSKLCEFILTLPVCRCWKGLLKYDHLKRCQSCKNLLDKLVSLKIE